MSAAHTPGPWHISGTHPRNIHIGAVGSPMVLASMNDCHTHTPANARLIAAAPDLAASCGEMLILLIALGLANAPTAPQRLAEYPQVIALRAALDKAGL